MLPYVKCKCASRSVNKCEHLCGVRPTMNKLIAVNTFISHDHGDIGNFCSMSVPLCDSCCAMRPNTKEPSPENLMSTLLENWNKCIIKKLPTKQAFLTSTHKKKYAIASCLNKFRGLTSEIGWHP